VVSQIKEGSKPFPLKTPLTVLRNCKMLAWLKEQPNEESYIWQTPYSAKLWRDLGKNGAVELVRKDGRFSRVKLKSPKETLEAIPLPGIILPSGKVCKMIPEGLEPVFCEEGSEELALYHDSLNKEKSAQKSDITDASITKKLVAQDNPIRAAVTNQGRGAEIKWKHLSFRSNHEVAIASQLDTIGVMFFPNAAVRLTENGKRVTKEVDFLVCRDGHWGILEVDGFQHRESRAEDMMRDDAFTDAGVWFIRRYPAATCSSKPEWVAQDFITRLDTYYSRLK
jgi:hypothetical protein